MLFEIVIFSIFLLKSWKNTKNYKFLLWETFIVFCSKILQKTGLFNFAPKSWSSVFHKQKVVGGGGLEKKLFFGNKTHDQRLGANSKNQFLLQICYFFCFFLAFLHKKCWEWLFRPAFGVRSTQTLVKIYNMCCYGY